MTTIQFSQEVPSENLFFLFSLLPPHRLDCCVCLYSRPLAHNQTENNGGLSTYPGPAASATQPPPPPAAHPLDYGSQAQQRQGTPQQQLFASETSVPVAPLSPSRGSGSGSGSDPLSHFLLRPDGMQMERDTPLIPPPPTTTDQQPESATRFDFGINAPAGAQTLPPPSRPEPVVAAAGGGWGGDSAPEASHVGGRDGFSGERVGCVGLCTATTVCLS